jgi:hypothetical protein
MYRVLLTLRYYRFNMFVCVRVYVSPLQMHLQLRILVLH